MKNVIILGGHGDGKVIVSALQDQITFGKHLMIYGFLNDFERKGEKIAGFPVLDKIENARRFLGQKDIYFITALLKVKETHKRSQIIERLRIPHDRYYTLIHPQATVSKSAKIGPGTFVGPHVTIMPDSLIGRHCSLRASANVGHDCVIGNYCYIGPNATLSGRVHLKDGVHIGPNASVLDRLELGSYSIIGMGSVVLKSVSDFTIAFGCPARNYTRLQRDEGDDLLICKESPS